MKSMGFSRRRCGKRNSKSIESWGMDFYLVRKEDRDMESVCLVLSCIYTVVYVRIY